MTLRLTLSAHAEDIKGRVCAQEQQSCLLEKQRNHLPKASIVCQTSGVQYKSEDQASMAWYLVPGSALALSGD